ncbi:MAG: HTH domain-containing protein [Clostridiales bacterium]|nr:HTH domain-containing protein [Clostridiales bacterium]
MRNSDIMSDILNVLYDYQIHTMSEIADKVEVSRQTVHKYIQSLSKYYNIETFVGGINRGGVRLIGKKTIDIDYLSNDDLQLVIEQLRPLLQRSDGIKRLVSNLDRLVVKEQEYDRFRKENCSRKVG